MSNKLYAYAIIIVFASLFLIISGVLFTVIPQEHYLLASIIDMGLLVVGVKIMTKIKLPGDKKDLA